MIPIIAKYAIIIQKKCFHVVTFCIKRSRKGAVVCPIELNPYIIPITAFSLYCTSIHTAITLHIEMPTPKTAIPKTNAGIGGPNERISAPIAQVADEINSEVLTLM